MNKKIVLVRCNDRDDVIKFVDDLRRKIKVLYNFQSNTIYTKNLIIKYIVIPIHEDQRIYVRGMRSDTCFNFDNSAIDYLTKGKGTKYKGTLLDYILENEGLSDGV